MGERRGGREARETGRERKTDLRGCGGKVRFGCWDWCRMCDCLCGRQGEVFSVKVSVQQGRAELSLGGNVTVTIT